MRYKMKKELVENTLRDLRDCAKRKMEKGCMVKRCVECPLYVPAWRMAAACEEALATLNETDWEDDELK